MTFFETFSAVLMAQLLAFIAQDLIAKYVKPHWDKTHNKVTGLFSQAKEEINTRVNGGKTNGGLKNNLAKEEQKTEEIDINGIE